MIGKEKVDGSGNGGYFEEIRRRFGEKTKLGLVLSIAEKAGYTALPLVRYYKDLRK